MAAAMDIPVRTPEPMPSFESHPRTARIPVDEITARARDIRFGHALLTLAGWVLYGSGWVIARALGGAWLAVSWCLTAAAMGWAEARGQGPTKSALIEENAKLRLAVKRLGGEA